MTDWSDEITRRHARALLSSRSRALASMAMPQTAVEQLTSAVENLDLQMVQGDYGDGCLGGDHAVEPLRLLLLRFLRGNAFSVSKALAQVT